MNKLWLTLGICLILCSCSTSKFDYQTAYRFKYQQEQQERQHTGEQQDQVQVLGPSLAEASDGTQEQVPEQLEVSLKPAAKVATSAYADQVVMDQGVAPMTKESFDALSKTEKRVIRQQAKEDLKSLKMQVKKAKQEAATKDVVFNKKMYIGLVIFAAGLLVAILASGPIGAIGIIVGIGLIAWGFIEQA